MSAELLIFLASTVALIILAVLASLGRDRARIQSIRKEFEEKP